MRRRGGRGRRRPGTGGRPAAAAFGRARDLHCTRRAASPAQARPASATAPQSPPPPPPASRALGAPKSTPQATQFADTGCRAWHSAHTSSLMAFLSSSCFFCQSCGAAAAPRRQTDGHLDSGRRQRRCRRCPGAQAQVRHATLENAGAPISALLGSRLQDPHPPTQPHSHSSLSRFPACPASTPVSPQPAPNPTCSSVSFALLWQCRHHHSSLQQGVMKRTRRR